MGTKERRDREREATRELIMTAARELFVRDGYEAVSMRKIADAIEYSPTAIYVHFADKEALLRAMVSDDFDRLAREFSKLAEIADPIERIRQSGRTYVRFGVQNPNHYRLMFMTAKTPAAQGQEASTDPDCSAFHFLKHAVSEAIAAGRFLPDVTDADLLACTFWATVHGIASLYIVKSKEPWMEWPEIETLITVAGDGVIRGVLRDPSELPLEVKRPVAGPAKHERRSKIVGSK